MFKIKDFNHVHSEIVISCQFVVNVWNQVAITDVGEYHVFKFISICLVEHFQPALIFKRKKRETESKEKGKGTESGKNVFLKAGGEGGYGHDTSSCK